MAKFKSGDVVIDYGCHGRSYANKFDQYLIGVVSKHADEMVLGDWLYEQGWLEDYVSHENNVERAPVHMRDKILADWTAWRLRQ